MEKLKEKLIQFPDHKKILRKYLNNFLISGWIRCLAIHEKFHYYFRWILRCFLFLWSSNQKISSNLRKKCFLEHLQKEENSFIKINIKGKKRRKIWWEENANERQILESSSELYIIFLFKDGKFELIFFPLLFFVNEFIFQFWR